MVRGHRVAERLRMISRPIGAASRMTTQSIWNRRTSRQTWRWRSVKKSGEKCQMASFGQISRRPPPAKPQPIANGRASLARDERRDADHQARRSRRRTGRRGDRRETPGERQVGGVVVDEQARDDAGRQRDAEARRKNQPLGPIPLLVSRMRRNHGNRTSIVASTATTASLTTRVVRGTARPSALSWPGHWIIDYSCPEPSSAELSPEHVYEHMIRPFLVGFATTFKHLFKQPITVNYPDQKVPVFPKYRGKQVLMRDENGLEKCVACGLCAVACPADAIYLEAAENDGTVQAGPRYAKIYQIHKTRCIFCGYCEEACPVSAIFMGKDYELAVYSNKDFIWDKQDLLVPAATSK